MTKLKVGDYFKQRQNLNKLKIKQKKRDENRAAFEKRYPFVGEVHEEIVALSLVELSEKLKNGDLTAKEVLEAFFAKAVQVNKTTNAVTEFLEDAYEQARLLDLIPEHQRKPLHGVPISVKVFAFEIQFALNLKVLLFRSI